MYKGTAARIANRTAKKGIVSRKRTIIPVKSMISATRRMMIAAGNSLNAQRPAVINQASRTISTNGSWVNALEITPNPVWVTPRSGESYVWGRNDSNGPAAVVARRFMINRNINSLNSARLFLSVDNFAIVLINGRAVVIDNPQDNQSFFREGRRFNIRSFLRRGRNDIVIAAFNFPSNANRSANNPAGVLARIEIQF